jgi:hypothetical protein
MFSEYKIYEFTNIFRVGVMAQVVEHLPGKHEVLKVNYSTNNNKNVSKQTIYRHISFKQYNWCLE